MRLAFGEADLALSFARYETVCKVHHDPSSLGRWSTSCDRLSRSADRLSYAPEPDGRIADPHSSSL
jgi:hypothetical protein